MIKHLFAGAFFLGAIAVIWVAAGFLGTNHLALTMTLVIGTVYALGGLEVLRFRQATQTLTAALAALAAMPEPLARLEDWLDGLHPSLRNPVRLRIEGERIALPGPTLTPYLVGLLVMLGMLGTFLGMVVTLNGAVFALEGSADLAAIRAALAAPIKGLGLAFGTSVAGVAASAMLGLMAALSRRERLLATQVLDNKIATVLHGFSLTHQRQEAYKAMQAQATVLPQVAERLQAMMAQIEHSSQQLNERLLSNQQGFHGELKDIYTDLALAVDKSLRDSLSQGAQVAGESIRPVVEAAMTGIARDAGLMHERMLSGAEQSLAGFSAGFEQRAQSLVNTLSVAAEDLIRSRIAAEAEWNAQHGAHMEQLLGLLRSELGTLRNEEAERGAAAVARLAELQTAVSAHLTTLGTALEEPLTRLMASASEAPRAAAEVIAQLRQEISHGMARDNALLEERSRIMETLSTLLAAINHAAAEQRAVIDALVASSATALNQAGSQFAEQVGAGSAQLAEVATQVSSSALEVSSLSDAFSFAVQSFGDANEKLIANLQRIEAAMDKSMARSDEQLAYYVAQAREVIDLSVMSQKEIVDELHTLRRQQGRQAIRAEEAN